MSNIIDWSKPIQTAAGHPAQLVKVLKTDYPHKYLCLISLPNDETCGTFRENGQGSIYTIQNVPEKKKTKYRPWLYDEVPIGIIVRYHHTKEELLIVGKKQTKDNVYILTPLSISTPYATWYNVVESLGVFEQKTDDGWMPCGVLIEDYAD